MTMLKNNNINGFPTTTTKNVPKVVVIIGNGFDLDLNLPTSYKDFVESSYFKYIFTGVVPRPLFIIEGKYSEQMIDHPEYNELANVILQEEKKNNWIDLEICIKNYCKLHKDEVNSERIRKEIYTIRYLLFKYLQQYNILHRPNDIPTIKKRVAFRLIQSLIEQHVDWNIWSFNYTDKCRDLLALAGVSDIDKNIRFHHMHGDLISSQNKFNIILGTDYDEDVAQVCPTAIKCMGKEDYYETKKLYDEHIKEADCIVIMGASIGETDRQYFENILDNRPSVIFITYNENSESEMMINLNKVTTGGFIKLRDKGDIDFRAFQSKQYYGPYGSIDESSAVELERILSYSSKSIKL